MRYNRLELISALFRGLFFLCVSILDLNGLVESRIFEPSRILVLFPIALVYVAAPILIRGEKGVPIFLFALDTGILLTFLSDVGFDSPLAVFAPVLILSAYYRGTPTFALAVALSLSAIFSAAHLSTGRFLLFRELFTLTIFPLVYALIRIGRYSTGFEKYRRMYLDLESSNRELEEHANMLEQKLSTHTIIDPVTGLKNFRYFRARIEEEVSRARRRKVPFSLCVAEVDDFDTFVAIIGKRERDVSVQKIAQMLCECVRTTDLAGRLSDNRFILLFLDSDARSSLIPALRIKKSMEGLRFGPSLDYRLTIGMGICTYPTDVEEVGGMISLASLSLDRSKQKGKGMITLASSLWKHQL